MVGRANVRWRLSLAALALTLAFDTSAAAGTVTYSYDEQGRVTAASYSDGTTIVYAYDPSGNRTSTVVNSGGCTTLWSSTAPTWGAPTLWCKALASPVAYNVAATVLENTTGNPIALSTTNAAPTSVAVSTAASHGAASASGTAISYTPTSGYTGSDSFQYTATNGVGTSQPATASLTVLSPGHVSPNPVWSTIFGQVPTGNLTECNGAQTIQGISIPITLQLTRSAGAVGPFTYSHNSGTATTWVSGATVVVNNNDTLSFCVTQTGTGQALGTITVTNETDSNTVLNSFTYSVTVGTPP